MWKKTTVPSSPVYRRSETGNLKQDKLLFNSWYLHRVEEVGSALAALERLGDKEEKYKLETDCKSNSDMSQMQLSKITMKQMCMPSDMIINNKDRQHTDLGDKIVMIGQMGATVHTTVTAVAGVQIGLERLGFCQLHHVWAGPKTQRETSFLLLFVRWVNDLGTQFFHLTNHKQDDFLLHLN